MIWTGKGVQKVWDQSSKDKWHFLLKKPLRAELEKEYLWIIFDDAKEGFWHIWGRYDPNNLWELFGNFGSDRNIGCFTT